MGGVAAGSKPGVMSTAVELEVEGIQLVRATAYVFARVLEPGDDVSVHEGSTLAGAPLHPYLDMPRAIDADGNPRLDVFAFALQHSEDRMRFEVGQRVTLLTPT